MSSDGDKGSRTMARGAIAAAVCLIAALALASSSPAAQDQLRGGSVSLRLASSHGLKLRPGALNLPITGGAIDPVDGSGTALVSGGFRAKRGKAKTKVKILSFTFGPHGGVGSIAAKIGKRRVSAFGTLSGGTVARDGWGARIENVTATLARKGALALNRAFAPRKKRKGAGKSRARGVRAGQPLGTIVSATTVPLAVEVLPGSGTMTLATNLTGGFASKLPQHCISLLGVTAIPPAQMELLPPGAFSFPVSGGSAAPDFSAGELLTAGGQTLTKDDGLLTPSACASAGPAVGTKLVSTEIGVNFAQGSLMSTATLPTGASLRAPLANIDFSTATRSVDPNTKQLTVSGATVTLSFPAALTLNTFFPTESGDPSDDFAAGDEIGTIDVTGKLR